MPKVYFCRKIGFRASHQFRLARLSPEENRRRFGAVSRSHEHRWEVTIWLQGSSAGEFDTVADLGQVDGVLTQEILEPFQNRHINDVDPAFFAVHLPTNEVLARYFAQKLLPQLPGLVKVRVAESADLFAEWVA